VQNTWQNGFHGSASLPSCKPCQLPAGTRGTFYHFPSRPARHTLLGGKALLATLCSGNLPKSDDDTGAVGIAKGITGRQRQTFTGVQQCSLAFRRLILSFRPLIKIHEQRNCRSLERLSDPKAYR